MTSFIFASSASVYGPGGSFDGTWVCRPTDPYAQSKWQAEQEVLMAFHGKLRQTILRLWTIIGYASTMCFDAVANRFVYLAGLGRSFTFNGMGE